MIGATASPGGPCLPLSGQRDHATSNKRHGVAGIAQKHKPPMATTNGTEQRITSRNPRLLFVILIANRETQFPGRRIGFQNHRVAVGGELAVTCEHLDG